MPTESHWSRKGKDWDHSLVADFSLWPRERRKKKLLFYYYSCTCGPITMLMLQIALFININVVVFGGSV